MAIGKKRQVRSADNTFIVIENTVGMGRKISQRNTRNPICAGANRMGRQLDACFCGDSTHVDHHRDAAIDDLQGPFCDCPSLVDLQCQPLSGRAENIESVYSMIDQRID